MAFTAEQALEASEENEPILITANRAAALCRLHACSYSDYVTGTSDTGAFGGLHDAWAVLLWLGY